MASRNDKPRYVACMSNEGYPASLVTRRLYRCVADPDAEREGMLRVIDESGEDYLYPAHLFLVIDLPHAIEKAFQKAG